MKLNKLFLFGLMAIAGLASCVSEDFPQGQDATNAKGEQGVMKLSVAIAEPAGTRANSAYTDEQLAAMPKANDYPIEIYDSQNKSQMVELCDGMTLSLIPEDDSLTAEVLPEELTPAEDPADISESQSDSPKGHYTRQNSRSHNLIQYACPPYDCSPGIQTHIRSHRE